MDGAFDHVMAAIAVLAVMWAGLVLPLVFFALASNRARCSESDAILAEVEAGELRRLRGAYV